VKILLTGFSSFKGVRANPCEGIVRELGGAGSEKTSARIIAEVLPVEYRAATRRIRRLIREQRPDAILCLGVAAKRNAISLERVALNVDDDPTPDNAGLIRAGSRIVREGPAAYFSTLPLQRLRAALQKRRIPVSISNHAGAFLCNHVFYIARHEAGRSLPPIPCGFIHVPLRLGGRATARSSLRRMVEAVRCCLAVLQSGARS
jgi:pyroglutamyl-peptidase